MTTKKESPLECEEERGLRYSSGLGNQENEVRDEHGAGGVKSAGARESADKHREPAFRLFRAPSNLWGSRPRPPVVLPLPPPPPQRQCEIRDPLRTWHCCATVQSVTLRWQTTSVETHMLEKLPWPRRQHMRQTRVQLLHRRH